MGQLTSQRNNPEYLQNKIEHFISIPIWPDISRMTGIYGHEDIPWHLKWKEID